MTATGHAVIGTLIAAKIGNPTLAIPIAIASHVLADAFPHWDTATNIDNKGKQRVIKESVIDVIVGFILSFILISVLFPATPVIYAFILVIAAQFLDWITVPYYLFGIRFPLFIWAYKLQKKIDHTLKEPWGIINQVAILILLVILAKAF